LGGRLFGGGGWRSSKVILNERCDKEFTVGNLHVFVSKLHLNGGRSRL